MDRHSIYFQPVANRPYRPRANQLQSHYAPGLPCVRILDVAYRLTGYCFLLIIIVAVLSTAVAGASTGEILD